MMNKRIVISIIMGGIIVMSAQCSFTFAQNSARLNKIKNSGNFKKGKFQNSIPTRMIAKGKMIEVAIKFIKGGQAHRKPSGALPIVELQKENFTNPPSETLQFEWFGHSSVLIEFEKKRYLIDPMFSQRASVFQWIGPKRFHPVPLAMENMPHLDAIIISHNHYDHLDYDTIKKLSDRKLKFYVPLGVGKTLASWGINPGKIIEFDWWDVVIDANVRIISTPARHYSGRGIFARDETLWCSWVIMGEKHRIYFSGDTGMLPAFRKIGEMYGPFDITFMKIGAYDEAWPDIHINPEEAIQAHIELRGKRLIPIHWGTFDLGLHSWYEPVERLVTAAQDSNIPFSIPKVGEIISLTHIEEDSHPQYHVPVLD
jgi:L-ascorbate metabolism protein UlaG (beta-lactamase superfamily)